VLEGVQPFFPEPAVALEPSGGILQRVRRECALDDPPVLAPGEQAGALENRKVLHESGQRHIGALRELAHRRGTNRETLENRAPRGVRQRREHSIQVPRAVGGRFIVNHMV
jgi:hypothetical protein